MWLGERLRQGRGQEGMGLAGQMHRCSCGDGEDRGVASQAPWRVGAPPFMALSPREMCLHQEGVWGLPGFPLTQKEAETSCAELPGRQPGTEGTTALGSLAEWVSEPVWK